MALVYGGAVVVVTAAVWSLDTEPTDVSSVLFLLVLGAGLGAFAGGLTVSTRRSEAADIGGLPVGQERTVYRAVMTGPPPPDLRIRGTAAAIAQQRFDRVAGWRLAPIAFVVLLMTWTALTASDSSSVPLVAALFAGGRGAWELWLRRRLAKRLSLLRRAPDHEHDGG